MENVIVVVPSLFFHYQVFALVFSCFHQSFHHFFHPLVSLPPPFWWFCCPPLPLWVVLRSPLLPLTLPSSSSFLGWWCPSFGCLLNLGGAAFLPHSLGWWCLYSLWCDGAFLPSSPLLLGGCAFRISPCGWCSFSPSTPSSFGLVPFSPLLLWDGSALSLSSFVCVWVCGNVRGNACVWVYNVRAPLTHTHTHTHTHTRHTHTHPFTATHLQSSFLSPRGLDFDTPILFFCLSVGWTLIPLGKMLVDSQSNLDEMSRF